MAPKDGEVSPGSVVAKDADLWQCKCCDVRTRLSAVRARGEWADCTLAVGAGAKLVPAHRLLLASASPVLAAMLYGALSTPTEPLPLPDIEPPTAELLLEYIYTDKIEISCCDEACALYRLAHYFNIPHLEEFCSAYLIDNVTAECVLRVFEFAKLFDLDKLLKKCENVMSSKTTVVLSTGDATEVSVDTLAHMFALPTLSVRSEVELLQATERWVQGQQNVSEEEACKLARPMLRKIRFLTIDPAEFARHGTTKLLSQGDVMAILLNIHDKFTQMPMPQDLSISRQKRNPNNQYIGLIKAKVEGNLEKAFRSETILITDIPWAMQIFRKQESIHIDIECLHSNDQQWSVDAILNIRVLSHKKEIPDIKFSTLYQFSSSGDYDWYFEFILNMDWSYLKDPKRGYVSNGAIIVEACIDLSSANLHNNELKSVTIPKQRRLLHAAPNPLQNATPRFNWNNLSFS